MWNSEQLKSFTLREKLLDLPQTASTDNTDAEFWQESGLLILLQSLQSNIVKRAPFFLWAAVINTLWTAFVPFCLLIHLKSKWGNKCLFIYDGGLDVT